MSAPIIPGAESISVTGGSRGGVLLLHGYMGTVQTVRDWAMALAQAGFSVEAPLLPGHGTSVEDLLDTQWADYVRCAEDAYSKLAAHHQHIVLGGLCTGSMLAAWIALNHPETTVGLISINGFFKLPGHWKFSLLENMVESKRRFFPWFRGKNTEDPNAPAVIAYEQAAITPIMSMKPARLELWSRLDELHCPVLVLTSMLDTALSPQESKEWSTLISGPVEYVSLEHSNHIATLDYDKEIVEVRSVEFALALTSGANVRKEVA